MYLAESQDVPMETQLSGDHNDCDSQMSVNQVVEEGKKDDEEDRSQDEPEQDKQDQEGHTSASLSDGVPSIKGPLS